jgi:hypothetical protein
MGSSFKVHLVHQDKKAIWVQLDMMVSVKLDHPDKMYVRFAYLYFIDWFVLGFTG